MQQLVIYFFIQSLLLGAANITSDPPFLELVVDTDFL